MSSEERSYAEIVEGGLSNPRAQVEPASPANDDQLVYHAVCCPSCGNAIWVCNRHWRADAERWSYIQMLERQLPLWSDLVT